jgi:hypothetical protein
MAHLVGFYYKNITTSRRSHWPRGLRRKSTAARLLRSWIRIPPAVWMFVVSVVCCQVEVSAKDWSLAQRSPTDCGASLCVIKKPRKTRRLKPATGLWKKQPQWVVTPGKQTTTSLVILLFKTDLVNKTWTDNRDSRHCAKRNEKWTQYDRSWNWKRYTDLYGNTILRRGPGSVDGVATAYELDGPGIESRCGRYFPRLSRPALRPNQPPVQWVPGLSRG